MARTRPTPRVPPRPRTVVSVIRQMGEFEKKMRKYYPKNLRFFSNGYQYQPNCADNFQNPNSLVPQRSKRGFFRSFYAESSSQVPEPSRIPQNLRHLTIFSGSEIVLRKLIKQNKRLESIVFESKCTKIARFLKYLKNLRSIHFQGGLPQLSETKCKKIAETWGKTIEKINMMASNNDASVMEMILKLPKLKEFQLRSFSESFPYEKLQERDLNYKIHFGLGMEIYLSSIMKDSPRFQLADYVSVKRLIILPNLSKKMSLERDKIRMNSKRKHFLYPESHAFSLSLEPIFQNVSSLDLIVSEDERVCSRLGQLNNLKHLSIVLDEGIKDGLRNFFAYLNENVAPHKKLETLLIKAGVEGQKSHNENLALCFFEACSETLKKVHFEFKYHGEKADEAELFYGGLNKLKNLLSLSLFLDFQAFESADTIENLGQIISKLESLEELDFRIQSRIYQEKMDLRFPSQLKKLGIAMDSASAPFNLSKTVGSLSNLLHLELEFTDFSTAKWSKILPEIVEKLKLLEVLMLKKTKEKLNQEKLQQIKERLNGLMTASENLKLILFANVESQEMIIFRRNNCLWTEINPIIDDLSFEENMKISCIKNYQ